MATSQDIGKKLGSQLFTVELLQNRIVWHIHQLRQCYGEHSDLLGTGKRATSAEIPTEPIDCPSFPAEESRVQNFSDITVDVALEAAVEQPICPCYPI